MSDVWLNIVMVVVFVLIGGFFSGTELALISLRESQVRALSEQGRRGAALNKLLADPTASWPRCRSASPSPRSRRRPSARRRSTSRSPRRSSAGGGPGRSPDRWPSSASPRHQLPVAGPGRADPQAAGATAGRGSGDARRPLAQPAGHAVPADRLGAVGARPTALVRLFGGDPKVGGEAISQEELRDLVAAHESLTSDERRMIDEVFRAGESEVREVMTPRTEVDFLDASMRQPRRPSRSPTPLVAVPGDRPRRGRSRRLRPRPRPVPAQPSRRPGGDRGRPRPRGTRLPGTAAC